jgi:ABC-type xylose transport system permease subunit
LVGTIITVSGKIFKGILLCIGIFNGFWPSLISGPSVCLSLGGLVDFLFLTLNVRLSDK